MDRGIAISKIISNFAVPNWYGVVAQMVEQRTENPCVTGSIPVDATKKQIKKSKTVKTVLLFFISFC
jgi:hypothetical protein